MARSWACGADRPGSNSRSTRRSLPSLAGGKMSNPTGPTSCQVPRSVSTESAPAVRRPRRPRLVRSASCEAGRASNVVVARERPANGGTSSRENSSEDVSATMTVIGSWRMKSPSTPVTNSIGANTRIVVIEPEMLAGAMRRTAPLGSSGSASTASAITMTSSTIRPTLRIRPMSDTVFRLMPSRCRTVHVSPTTASTKVMVSSEARPEINRNVMMAATTMPNTTDHCSEPICASIDSDTSRATVADQPSVNRVDSSSRRRTRADTSRTSSPGGPATASVATGRGVG